MFSNNKVLFFCPPPPPPPTSRSSKSETGDLSAVSKWPPPLKSIASFFPWGNGAGGSGEQHIRMDHLQRSVEVGQLQIDLPPLLIILAVHAHRRRLDNARQAAGHLKAVGGVGAREGAMVRPGHHQAAALELVEQAEQRPAGVLKLTKARVHGQIEQQVNGDHVAESALIIAVQLGGEVQPPVLLVNRLQAGTLGRLAEQQLRGGNVGGAASPLFLLFFLRLLLAKELAHLGRRAGGVESAQGEVGLGAQTAQHRQVAALKAVLRVLKVGGGVVDGRRAVVTSLKVATLGGVVAGAEGLAQRDGGEGLDDGENFARQLHLGAQPLKLTVWTPGEASQRGERLHDGPHLKKLFQVNAEGSVLLRQRRQPFEKLPAILFGVGKGRRLHPALGSLVEGGQLLGAAEGVQALRLAEQQLASHPLRRQAQPKGGGNVLEGVLELPQPEGGRRAVGAHDSGGAVLRGASGHRCGVELEGEQVLLIGEEAVAGGLERLRRGPVLAAAAAGLHSVQVVVVVVEVALLRAADEGGDVQAQISLPLPLVTITTFVFTDRCSVVLRQQRWLSRGALCRRLEQLVENEVEDGGPVGQAGVAAVGAEVGAAGGDQRQAVGHRRLPALLSRVSAGRVVWRAVLLSVDIGVHWGSLRR
ncbi:hypothetical protein TYRP_006512 [Tyrophagus putrescentiae]|nr:hypothetical protein TYRP_006512 [Tyrophagus putrescentiae]